jgi:catechol 2,3-dioxygenase-like lactoylglutathione lyase family enzyme
MESADKPGVRPQVLQLRVVIEADDYDEAVRFFRDVLGLPTLLSYENPDDDRVVILEAGQATLEIGTPAHSRVIDRLEGAAEPSPGIRLALEVTDATAACAAARSADAVVGPLVTTPWGSLNARVVGPAATHLTLFQQLEPGPERGPATS